jgi:CO/xanthine dehydrogenase FAD-binding subunit
MTPEAGTGIGARPEAAADAATRVRVTTPASIEELTLSLGAKTAQSRFIAGGTDLVRSMVQDRWTPDLIVDLSGVPELRGIRVDQTDLRIGAATTFADIALDPLVLRHATCLARAAAVVGSAQTRNMATIGGNVGNASPCGDSLAPLLALEARALILDSAGATSWRPVGEILAGPGATTLRHDEVIVELAVPLPGDGWRSTYAKLGSRTMVSVARVGMAVVLRLDETAGAIAEARVAIGALGQTAFRAEGLEVLLAGSRVNESTREAFVAACPDVARQSIPGRYSLPYKQEAIRGVACDAWDSLGLGDGGSA